MCKVKKEEVHKALEMPETVDRRPLYDDQPDGYLEGVFDWADNNSDAVNWLADNHKAIREALSGPTKDTEMLNWLLGRLTVGPKTLGSDLWSIFSFRAPHWNCNEKGPHDMRAIVSAAMQG